MKWLASIGAALALAVAMFLWGLAPASECSTPQQINWSFGLPPFALFIIAGGYTAIRGTVGQRLLLFLASAAIIAAYVFVLSQSLQIVIAGEISCAAQGPEERERTPDQAGRP